MNCESLLFVVNPAGARGGGPPLTLAHWTGASLTLMAQRAHGELATELEQRAVKMGIAVSVRLTDSLRREDVLKAAHACASDLLVLDRDLAHQLFPHEPERGTPPLWLLHQSRAQTRNIVAVLPRIDGHTATLRLREEVCELGLQLAAALNGELTLLQVWKPPRLMLGRGRQAHLQEEAMADEEAGRQLEVLEQFAADYRDTKVPITTWLQHGDLAARLLARIGELRTHAVVLGWDTAGPRGLAGEGWDLLRRDLPCSMLLVRR